MEIKLRIEIFTSWEKITFFKPNIETAPSVGIDRRKDILAASNLLKFNILADEIEIPDLLTPGIRESTWKKPIKIADLKLKLSSILFFNLNLSLK